MKATELRIGNLVYGYFNPQDVGNQTTAPIVKVKAKDLELGNSFGVWFKPIPLTEEWLVRLGFELKHPKEISNKGFYNDKIDYSYSIDGTLYVGCDDGNGYGIPSKIRYVHQLQNLYFALTGEELIYKP